MEKAAVKPTKLQVGDKIRVISPSSPFELKNFNLGVSKLARMGLRVTYRKDIFTKSGYLSGTDERRLAELQEAFLDSETKAIFCARGGYGATRLLEKIDYNVIIDNPKIFIGFSDVSALHIAFNSIASLATFHGPMVASRKFVLMDRKQDFFMEKALFTTQELVYRGLKGVHVLQKGFASGILVGGNLSILGALVGTRFLPDLKGKILFFEDTQETPYRIDRIICHLSQAGVFQGITGLVVGTFIDEKGKSSSDRTRVIDKIIIEYFSSSKIPILSGFPIGHGANNYILPLGTFGRIDTSKKELVLEPGVTD
jgi:muramoyltetrapeptide carboxypeptidase